ncbi:MAG: hypothetical protein IJM84_05455 [Bacteroidaceae bacterium]|uniref:hypothetical protein n=1 Tax=Pseudoprevotella muciniphila TaxID=2133944 RepID=UPI0018688CE2|nr:hypothetical protein [Pseudoprevotella muciniphila]MBQ7057377.1 hypothetical protein [Bacteroidaceae bacterium]
MYGQRTNRYLYIFFNALLKILKVAIIVTICIFVFDWFGLPLWLSLIGTLLFLLIF